MAEQSMPSVVRLVNDIAQNLAYRPDAVDAVVSHIVRFWDPRMRATLVDWVGRGGAGLNDIARAATRQLVAP